MTEATIQTVRNLIREFVNAHDPASADLFFTEDFHWVGRSVGSNTGREAYKRVMPGFWTGLPDAQAKEEDIFAIGDTVIARLTVCGTHTGQLWGLPPTGPRVSWQAVMIYEFRGSRVAKQWAAEDWTAVHPDRRHHSTLGPRDLLNPTNELNPINESSRTRTGEPGFRAHALPTIQPQSTSFKQSCMIQNQ
ncbi:ester cyclase [Humibacter sp.]|jgi:predicted ester cyclase|uniref:ester cyclase n=1 Tax=Humibacter sp. TaxID=1940291 RepID=UPI002B676225|nr:ester cyclase [Humibacter sp.]HVX09134.1 ester cyclase [Humibacter sp.]